MGLFGNNKADEFKNKLVDFINFLSNYNIRDNMYPIAYTEIHNELKKLAVCSKSFEDPFSIYFKYYSLSTSLFGDKKSIAEGLFIAYICTEIVLRGEVLTTAKEKEILQLAKEYCMSSDKWSTYYGIIDLC